MPESAGSETDIPDDIRHLKDFPHYDASLHDNPQFRQNLTAWANKTDKLSSVLDALTAGFTDFHATGTQQYKAAMSITAGLQKMSQLLQNSSPTITEPLNKFADSLNNMWHYYDTFLNQTEVLMVDPIKKMAKEFVTLKGFYEELQKYRKEFIMAADQMCACRHVSKLNDTQHFNQLAETCYNAQKTYQLVLSKYLTCLREAHTVDMMDMLRRLVEHFLSMYSFQNYCTSQMKELEVYMNQIFNRSKEWKMFYSGELETWNELQRHVKKVVMLDYQHHVDNMPTNDSTTSRLSMLKPGKPAKKKTAPANYSTTPVTAFARTPSDQNVTFPLPSPSFVPPKVSPIQTRRTNYGSPLTSPKLPPSKVFSVPTFSTQKSHDKSLFGNHLRMMRSNSDADLLGTCDQELIEEDREISNLDIGPVRRRSQSTDDMTMSGENGDSLETASEKIQEVLDKKDTTKSSNKHFIPSFLTHLRRKESKEKSKSRNRAPSFDIERPRSGSTTPIDSLSTDNSPFTNRKKRVFFQKTRNSLQLYHQDESRANEEECNSLEGRGSVEGGSSISSGEQLTDANLPSISNGTLSSPPPYPNAVPFSPHPKDVVIKELINPVPPSWIKSGYLMLRMKLPNNTYAWTYIYCVVNRDSGHLMVQEQSLRDPRPLEDLMLCTVKAGTPDFIDRNFCFRVISPTTEHLFQTLSEKDMQSWMSAVQEGIEGAIKHGDTGTRTLKHKKDDEIGGELVSNANKLLLKVPGNKQCADCSSTDVQWASINLGIVLCIECSGVHRGLGVHVSKVRSLTLDKWNKSTVQFMQTQGNAKSNGYYECRLGKGSHHDVHKPSANAGKLERMQFIQLKYVTLAFAPELTAS